jgi:hypothetical protein
MSAEEPAVAELREHLARGRFLFVRQQCEQILLASPEHEEVRSILEEATEREALLNGSGSATLSIRAVRCNGCGASLTPSTTDALVITCTACRTAFDLATGDTSSALSVDQRRKTGGRIPPPKSFLALGAIGTLRGASVQIRGRLCYQGEIREWDAEDEEYWTGPWSYDEWVLLSEDGRYYFLTEDREGFSLSMKTIPEIPTVPEPHQNHLTLHAEHGVQPVLERGTVTLQYLEGEFSWIPRAGETLQYAEYEFKGNRFGVEWHEHEVEFYEAVPLTELDVARAFDQREIVEAATRDERIGEAYQSWSPFFLVASVVMAFFLVASLRQSGEEIFHGTHTVSKLAKDGLMLGPFPLSPEHGVHLIRMEADIVDNSSSAVALELLDAAGSPVNEVEADFWSESGYDDGPWREWETAKDYYFRVEQEGNYYAKLYLDETTAREPVVEVSIRRSVGLSRYYLISCIMTLLYGVILYRYRSMNPIYLLLAMFVAVTWIIENLPDDDGE